MTDRLPLPFGSAIDRNEPIEFEFEGRPCSGFAGDSIASALAANQQWVLSRSFKYHRPRGILTLAGQDANTLVQLPSNPNIRADCHLIEPGLVVRGQNYQGSLRKDRLRWLDRCGRFLPVGFYYKAFYRPSGIWNWWARLIRRGAGLGVIDRKHQPPIFDKQYRFFDVVVIGAGPAGMSQALDAAATGAEVLLVDENPRLGGALNYSRMDCAGTGAAALLSRLRTLIEARPNIEVMLDTRCNGWFADHWLALVQPRRLVKVRCEQTIVCTGALEQPAVFRNNDLPGIMLAGAAQRLMRLYGVRPGNRAVILTAGAQGYATALDLADAGVAVAAIVDLRDDIDHDDPWVAAVKELQLPVVAGHAIYEALAKNNHLCQVEVRPIISAGRCADGGRRIECDLLCVATGAMPAWQLPCQAGARLDYLEAEASFALRDLPDGMTLAGSVAGEQELARIVNPQWAGAELQDMPGANPASHVWPIFAHPRGKEFVDFDEDLQIADIRNAVADGYADIQLVKRFTTAGMGPSQGRQSALTTARLVAQANQSTVAETGLTTARPPTGPELIAHNAGRSFYPARRSSIHHRHEQAGACMMQAGAWYRPAYYGTAVDTDALIRAEAANVRNNVGMIDVSTLGGLEIRGPDSGEFMNRIYTLGFAKQPVGKSRYALMCNQAGAVIDDGVACRLKEDHYYVTATTGGVDGVHRAMLKWQAQWRLDLDIANVTSAWCAINVAGPRSRKVLQELCDSDLSNNALPYMGVLETWIAGIPARLLRVGFVGELGFEIHAPQLSGEALWDALANSGAAAGIQPFGVEAQRLLRLEKGHVIIGQDTDAMTTPQELQMGWAIGLKKKFFVGQRSMAELQHLPPIRRMVGFSLERGTALPKEGHLLMDGQSMVGRVTSCALSPTLDRVIGLAYAPPDCEPGSTINIKIDGGRQVTAQVVATPFFDPDNHRQTLQ